MRRLALLLCLLLAAGAARAETADEIRAAYSAFVAAQNARDLEAVGRFFLDGPDFLWVSDGKSFWGREAVLARMASFQQAEVWRVEPDLAGARVALPAPDTALLHLRLTLVIGPAADPDRLDFLVSILFVRNEGAWRIAALLTTTPKF